MIQTIPIITVETNKLVLNESAKCMLGAKPKERILINYWQVNASEHFPVIAKSELFTDSTDGNILTNKNTISYKGQQNKILLEYGNAFTLEPFKNWFKMIPIDITSIDGNVNPDN